MTIIIPVQGPFWVGGRVNLTWASDIPIFKRGVLLQYTRK